MFKRYTMLRDDRGVYSSTEVDKVIDELEEINRRSQGWIDSFVGDISTLILKKKKNKELWVRHNLVVELMEFKKEEAKEWGDHWMADVCREQIVELQAVLKAREDINNDPNTNS